MSLSTIDLITSNSARVIGNSSSLTNIDSLSSRKRIFDKEGYIFLNGRRVHITSSIKETARNINKVSAHTGIKAKIVQDARGNERLVLTSSRRIVNILDPQGILSSLFAKNKIGKSADKLIQVIGVAF